MATNSEILTQAMSRLGQRTSTRVRADILAEINDTIDEFERGDFLPWFLESTESLGIVADDTFVALPTNFAREEEDTRPYFVNDGKTYFLTKKVSLAALQAESEATSLKYYALHGGSFHFRMTADKAYTVYLPCLIKQTGNLADNDDTVSNLWLTNAKNWVLSDALAKVAGLHLNNTDLAQKHLLAASIAKEKLYRYHESRVHTNQDYFVGGASDGS